MAQYLQTYMAVLKTVLKVAIWCQKCQQKLLQAVCKLEGLDKIDVDAEKGLLTVIGEADPQEIICRARKACKHAEVVSIGPPPKENPKEEKAEPKAQTPTCGNGPPCQPMAVVHWEQWDQPPFMCCIL